MQFQELLKEYQEVFAQDLCEGLLPQRFVQHGIDVVQVAKPISRPPYQLSVSEANEIERQLAD